MKNTRKMSLFLLVCFIFVTIIPAVYAEAELSSSDKAIILNRLSIISGSNNSFKLDEPLKRCEAAAFIVRIMGQETYVLDNTELYSETGFPDVLSSDWFAPYVGYCIEQEIMGGLSNGKFGSNGNITEKEFLKILLGALGYREDVDFNWDNIYQFAYNLNIVTDPSYATKTADNTAFKREAAVNMLYCVLTAKSKNEGINLIRGLVLQGVITKEVAMSTGLLSDKINTAISEITAPNGQKVIIKLNENVETLEASDIKIYEAKNTTKKLTFTLESQAGNEIVLNTLQQSSGVDYTLELSGVKDLEGNVYPSLSGTFKAYEEVKVESDFFRIEKAEAVSKNMINIYFTQPVNINSELPSYYEVFEGDTSFAKGSFQTATVKCISGTDRGITLYLKNKSLSAASSYTLKVSGKLTSVYGTKLGEGGGDTVPFSGSDKENESLALKKVEPLNDKTLQLEFNTEVSSFYAQNTFNYMVEGPSRSKINISKAEIAGEGSEKGKFVRLTLSESLDATKQYELMVKYVTDYMNHSAIIDNKYSFSGKIPAKADFALSIARSTDARTILLYFNRRLDKASVLNAENYVISGVSNLEYLTAPEKVYYDPISEPNVVLLILPKDKSLEKGKSYKITVMKTLEDVAGNVPKEDMQLSFKGTDVVPAAPSIVEAKIISGDSILLRTNKEITLETPNILPSNYSLEYKDENATVTKLPVFVGYINATTLVLKFDSLDLNMKYTLKCDTLKDFAEIGLETAQDGPVNIDVSLTK